MPRQNKIAILLALALPLALTGCKSYWVDATVDNQSGQAATELEVAYPTASFGANRLAPGATMHYRFQIRGQGPVKIDYTTETDRLRNHAQGPDLVEHQHGQLRLVLEPHGKVTFIPQLESAN